MDGLKFALHGATALSIMAYKHTGHIIDIQFNNTQHNNTLPSFRM